MTDLIGHRVGHYHLIKLIGRGGYADVYLGVHILLGISGAVKILRRPLARKWRQQFLREARLAASLEHDNIINILDSGMYGEMPYLVMRYALNGSLRKRYPVGTKLPVATMLPYLEQTADALDYLHTKGLVHMDIKPENLLLDSNDEVRLTDFGIAELARSTSTQRTGTPAYMSPEQIRGRASAASDQYALAVVVYEWLTGQLPFTGTRKQIFQQKLRSRPRSLRALAPDISPEVERIVLRALERDPHLRYPSVKAFVQALKRAMPPVIAPDESGETLSLTSYLLKVETWEEVSKFFTSKMFISVVIAFFTFLLSRSMDIAWFAFGVCIPLMPLQEIFRRRNLLAQSIAYCAFLISLAIYLSLHLVSAFPLAQVSFLTVCIWIIFLRKRLLNLRLDADSINKLRTWLDLFKRFIL